MPTTLVATPRTASGSAAARRLRNEGHVPAVIYGHGMAPLSLSVERRELRLALSGAAGVNTVLTIELSGASYPAVVKDLQRHPIKRTVSHIDFQRVDMNEQITVHVPMRIEGEAKAVIAEGGLVDPAVDTIEVTCTPATIPTEIVVDVTNLEPHGMIRLADITLPAGVVANGDPDMLIVAALVTAAAEAEAAAGDAEGEAPAAAE